MDRPVKHSHTSLALYTQCPYKYYRERVVKDIPWEQNEAARWGETVHNAIEKFFLTGDFPPLLAPYKVMIMRAAAMRGERSTEMHLAVDKDWRPCDYKDPAAYFRGKVDLVLSRPDDRTVIAVDWKTGTSRYSDGSQERRYAAMLFAAFPDVEHVRARWVYFKDSNVSSYDFDRSDEPDLRDSVDSVVREIGNSRSLDAWPKKPTALCRAYCGVVNCEYNGRRK